MDHHCMYINNCIGFGNYKVFMNLIIYGWLCCIHISLTMHEAIPIIIHDELNSYSFTFTFVFAYVFVFLLMLLVGYFVYYHFRLIFSGLTTIESKE